jgi:chromosome segregation ATPase
MYICIYIYIYIYIYNIGGGATEFSSKPKPNPQNEDAAKQALELNLELKAMQSALDALNEAKDSAMRERDSERERASERASEREKLCIENTALKESLQKKIDECSTLSAHKRKVDLELHAANEGMRNLLAAHALLQQSLAGGAAECAHPENKQEKTEVQVQKVLDTKRKFQRYGTE